MPTQKTKFKEGDLVYSSDFPDIHGQPGYVWRIDYRDYQSRDCTNVLIYWVVWKRDTTDLSKAGRTLPAHAGPSPEEVAIRYYEKQLRHAENGLVRILNELN